MDEAALAAMHDQYHALEEEGFRVLGIAWRQVSLDHPHAVVTDETELVLAGFAAFLDPPKESAASALEARDAPVPMGKAMLSQRGFLRTGAVVFAAASMPGRIFASIAGAGAN